MPDDEKIEEQEDLNEEEDIDEGAAAFDEDEDATPKEEKKEEPESDKEEKKEEEEEKPEDKKEEQEKDTAESRLNKRLESIEEEKEEEEETPKDERPKSESEDEKPDESQPIFTKEKVSEYLKSISSDDLPGEVVIGDTVIDLKKYAEEFPDDYNASKVIASALIEKAFGRIEDLIGVKISEIDRDFAKPEDLAQISQSVNQMSFETKVSRATDENGDLKHPDFYNIVYGAGMKDFHEWVEKQSKKIQTLARSLDPDDSVLLLDYYKENTAKNKTNNSKAKQRKEKDKYDALHEDTSSRTVNKRPRADNSDGDPDKIAKDAFDEDD